MLFIKALALCAVTKALTQQLKFDMNLHIVLIFSLRYMSIFICSLFSGRSIKKWEGYVQYPKLSLEIRTYVGSAMIRIGSDLMKMWFKNSLSSKRVSYVKNCEKMTSVGFEPTPTKTTALTLRLRPLGHDVLVEEYRDHINTYTIYMLSVLHTTQLAIKLYF